VNNKRSLFYTAARHNKSLTPSSKVNRGYHIFSTLISRQTAVEDITFSRHSEIITSKMLSLISIRLRMFHRDKGANNTALFINQKYS